MEIKKEAMAGTVESSDAMVTISPNPASTIEIQLKSVVERQFGKQIRKLAEDTLKELKIKSAILRIEDKGALDAVLRARIQAAADRASEEKVNWKERA